MGPVFPSTFEAVLFWVPLVVVVAVSGLWIARNRHPRGKRLHDAVPLIFLALATATVIGYARLGVLPHWVFYPVGLDYWIWPGRLAALGSSLSDLFGRLPARALPAWLSDGAGPA
jgi:hypothetical protein